MKRASILILLLTISFVGCRPKYSAAKINNTTTPKTQTLTVKDIVSQYRGANTEIQFLNLSDAAIEYTNDTKSYYVSAKMQIIKGKEISISIFPMLGIELFRLKFTPERFYIFDKLNRQYCDNSYQYLSKMLKAEVSYGMIESLLTNNIFSIAPNSNIDDSYVSTQMADKFILASKPDSNMYKHIMEISPSYTLTAMSVVQNMSQLIRVDYADFKIIDKTTFPTVIEAKTSLPTDNFRLKINIKKIEINKPFEIGTVNIGRYTKVQCSQII